MVNFYILLLLFLFHGRRCNARRAERTGNRAWGAESIQNLEKNGKRNKHCRQEIDWNKQDIDTVYVLYVYIYNIYIHIYLNLYIHSCCFVLRAAARPLFGLQESALTPEVTGASAAKFVLDAEIVDWNKDQKLGFLGLIWWWECKSSISWVLDILCVVKRWVQVSWAHDFSENNISWWFLNAKDLKTAQRAWIGVLIEHVIIRFKGVACWMLFVKRCQWFQRQLSCWTKKQKYVAFKTFRHSKLHHAPDGLWSPAGHLLYAFRLHLLWLLALEAM